MGIKNKTKTIATAFSTPHICIPTCHLFWPSPFSWTALFFIQQQSISMFCANLSSQHFINSRVSELLTVVCSIYCRSKHVLIGQESVDGGNRTRAQNWMPQTDMGRQVCSCVYNKQQHPKGVRQVTICPRTNVYTLINLNKSSVR